MSAEGSGALMGAAGGVLALGFVHAIDTNDLAAAIDRVAGERGVAFAATFLLGYLTAGALGAVAGGIFGNVTRFLRKWPALAIWSFVFFVSVAVVFIASLNVFSGGMHGWLAAPVIGAAALYSFVVSFSLPIRRAE